MPSSARRHPSPADSCRCWDQAMAPSIFVFRQTGEAQPTCSSSVPKPVSTTSAAGTFLSSAAAFHRVQMIWKRLLCLQRADSKIPCASITMANATAVSVRTRCYMTSPQALSGLRAATCFSTTEPVRRSPHPGHTSHGAGARLRRAREKEGLATAAAVNPGSLPVIPDRRHLAVDSLCDRPSGVAPGTSRQANPPSSPMSVGVREPCTRPLRRIGLLAAAHIKPEGNRYPVVGRFDDPLLGECSTTRTSWPRHRAWRRRRFCHLAVMRAACRPRQKWRLARSGHVLNSWVVARMSDNTLATRDSSGSRGSKVTTALAAPCAAGWPSETFQSGVHTYQDRQALPRGRS